MINVKKSNLQYKHKIGLIWSTGVILRLIPFTLTAKGIDTFKTIAHANNIIERGYITWVDDIFSFLGLADLSIETGESLMLSGIMVITNLNIYAAIFFLDIVYSTLVLFCFLSLARFITGNETIILSIGSSGYLIPFFITYTSFDASRGGFIALQVLFFYFIIILATEKTDKGKFNILSIFFLALSGFMMLSMHRMSMVSPFYLIIILSANFLLKTHNIRENVKNHDLYVKILAFIVLEFCFVSLLAIFRLYPLNIKPKWTSYFITLQINQLSAYVNIILEFIFRLGMFFPFFILGIISPFIKQNQFKTAQILLNSILLASLPLLLVFTWIEYFVAILFPTLVIFSGLGLGLFLYELDRIVLFLKVKSICKRINIDHVKYIRVILLMILVSVTFFQGFHPLTRPSGLISQEVSDDEFQMAKFIDNLNGSFLTNNEGLAFHLSALTGNVIFPTRELAWFIKDFIPEDEISYEWADYSYFRSFLILKKVTKHPYWYFVKHFFTNNISTFELNLIDYYNLKYYITWQNEKISYLGEKIYALQIITSFPVYKQFGKLLLYEIPAISYFNSSFG